jgi:hypothetical protein
VSGKQRYLTLLALCRTGLMPKVREGRKALPKALEAGASFPSMHRPCVGEPAAGHISAAGREHALKRCEQAVPGGGVNAAGLATALVDFDQSTLRSDSNYLLSCHHHVTFYVAYADLRW